MSAVSSYKHHADCGYQREVHHHQHHSIPLAEIGTKLADRIPSKLEMSHLYSGERTVARFKPLELWSEGFHIVYAMPGPFTPVCTKEHFPQIIATVNRCRDANISVHVLAKSNRDVMWAWADMQIANNQDAHLVKMIPDYLGDVISALGLGMDKARDASGNRTMDRDLGIVAMRSALFIGPGKDGTAEILHIEVEKDAALCTTSSPESFLKAVEEKL
jgi:peroxiredoxin